MDIDVILCIIWLVPFILSAFMVIYNYGTKCLLDSGKYFRIYTIGGLIIRIIISLIPFLTLLIFFVFVSEADNWYNIKTKKLCKRHQIKEKLSGLLNKHNII